MCNNYEYVVTCQVSGIHSRKKPSKQCAIDILEYLKGHKKYLEEPNYGNNKDWGGWD
jgi:surface antigen